jgi:hypothetical protein
MLVSAITGLKQQPLLRRYLLAEVVALMVAILSITLASRLTNSMFILIAASVYSSSTGYYSVLFVHTLYAERHIQRTGPGDCLLNSVVSTAYTLLLELGAAELLDSLLVSPLLLYLCLSMLPNHQLAVVLSELVSTLLFYTNVLIVGFIVQHMRKTEEVHL